MSPRQERHGFLIAVTNAISRKIVLSDRPRVKVPLWRARLSYAGMQRLHLGGRTPFDAGDPCTFHALEWHDDGRRYHRGAARAAARSGAAGRPNDAARTFVRRVATACASCRRAAPVPARGVRAQHSERNSRQFSAPWNSHPSTICGSVARWQWLAAGRWLEERLSGRRRSLLVTKRGLIARGSATAQTGRLHVTAICSTARG